MTSDGICQCLLEVKSAIGETILVAVSKYHTIEDIHEAYCCGQRDFGESRVQDLATKALHFQEKGITDIRWHFIGRLQTNKVNQLLRVPGLCFIHSIDSLHLLEALLSRSSQSINSSVGLLLQFHTSNEAEKAGFRDEDELRQGIELINASKTCFFWDGLMTMGPIRTDDFERDTRQSFSSLEQLSIKLSKDHPNVAIHLSMGMSSDYHWAIEYHTTYIRLGSLIFGE